MAYIIQNSVFPSFALCTQEELYFRHNDYVYLSMENQCVNMQLAGKISTNTYFNSVSVGKWKKYLGIDDLSFTLKFKGEVRIVWKLERLHYSSTILSENYLTSDNVQEISFSLPFWHLISDGMLYFEITALSKSQIFSFGYLTDTQPLHKVRLGIVITHFNRQHFVLSAVKRLKENLLNLTEFRDKISLYIVDNSKNLPKIDEVVIIENENLGGSGGFSRGLISLQENEQYTHCLFMDDDASCEVESIKRTLAFLEYSKMPELAIAGAMLREAEAYRQHENGARFDGLCRPNKSNLDLRDILHLLLNEEEEHIDYGGWWFLAFPIKDIHHYAFPYFVRGDDIGFGLKHKFKILTINGISTWQEDFSLKNGPLPYYLDARNHILQHFHELIPLGLKGILKTTARMCLKNLLTYNYETALAVVHAMEDAAKGSEFWRNNVNMLDKRKEILSLIKDEAVRDITVDEISFAVSGNPHENRFVRLFRWATLNGHLLPKFLFKKGYVWQNKGFGGSLREIYRYSQVLYIHWPTRKGFMLKHSKIKFFKYLSRYFMAVIKLMLNYDSLKRDYQSSYDELTSKEFWKKQFKQD